MSTEPRPEVKKEAKAIEEQKVPVVETPVDGKPQRPKQQVIKVSPVQGQQFTDQQLLELATKMIHNGNTSAKTFVWPSPHRDGQTASTQLSSILTSPQTFAIDLKKIIPVDESRDQAAKPADVDIPADETATRLLCDKDFELEFRLGIIFQIQFRGQQVRKRLASAPFGMTLMHPDIVKNQVIFASGIGVKQYKNVLATLDLLSSLGISCQCAITGEYIPVTRTEQMDVKICKYSDTLRTITSSTGASTPSVQIQEKKTVGEYIITMNNGYGFFGPDIRISNKTERTIERKDFDEKKPIQQTRSKKFTRFTVGSMFIDVSEVTVETKSSSSSPPTSTIYEVEIETRKTDQAVINHICCPATKTSAYDVLRRVISQGLLFAAFLSNVCGDVPDTGNRKDHAGF